ncbi:unnamed protein product, partial [Brenthis ino]
MVAIIPYIVYPDQDRFVKTSIWKARIKTSMDDTTLRSWKLCRSAVDSTLYEHVAALAHTYAMVVPCADSRLRGEFRRSRPLIYISPPIWVNNCPRSAPPSAAIHLATPNHCSPNVKRSSRSTTSAMMRTTDCGCCQSEILLLRTTLDTN